MVVYIYCLPMFFFIDFTAVFCHIYYGTILFTLKADMWC